MFKHIAVGCDGSPGGRDAVALGHGRDDPLLLGLHAGQRGPGRIAAHLAPDLAPGAGPVGLGPPDQGLAPQVGRADGRAAGEPVAAGQHADHRLAAEAELFEAGLLERGADEAHVDLAGAQLLDVEHRGAQAENQLDLGIAPAIRIDDRTGHPAGERPGEAHAQPASLPRPGGPGDCRRTLGTSQQVTGLAQQRLAGGGERGTAPVALEQLHAELGLERADLLADAGLGEVQAVRRAAKVQLLGHRDERAQLPALHRRMIGAAFHRRGLTFLIARLVGHNVGRPRVRRT